MVSMDVFKSDAFNTISLTTAIQDMKTVPGFLGSLGIFTPNPVRTEDVMVERRGQTLNIIPVTERGAPRTRRTVDRRNVRNFKTVRLAETHRLMAHSFQNIRAFGSESELEAVQTEVARWQMILANDLETTMERHRLSAINGILLDADGTTLYNYYTEFGIAAPTEIAFNWASRTDVRSFINSSVIRPMVRALGGRAGPGLRIIALCGDTFFDALIDNDEVRASYLNWQAAAELREGTVWSTFRYGGVEWINYRGTDDNNATTGVAIAADKCRFIPAGVDNVFQAAYSPGESMDYVNTLGLERYSAVVPDPTTRNEWVDLDVASYPLFMCTSPEALLQARSGA
jgi:Phage major capsid protein E